MNRDLSVLEAAIGYSFNNKSLLKHALKHSSYTNEKHQHKNENNERLEFLGDAVLELVCSRFLFEKYPNKPEGVLTKERASMVCEPALAYCAEKIDLGNYLLLGKGEEMTGGRFRESITSDAMEALIGAIFIDGGFEKASAFVHMHVLELTDQKRIFFDSKTVLQEIVQSKETEPLTYKVVDEQGPDHKKTFFVEAYIGDVLYGSGKGRTKKAAEQKAAYEAIRKLKG
ncbi:MAG: ribonuclease III [Clostridiales bacterium]|nr:ribonuclease III [Clostridiales bacterium]